MQQRLREVEKRLDDLAKYIKEMRWKLVEYSVPVKAIHLFLLELSIQSENIKVSLALINLEIKKEKSMIKENDGLINALEEYIINKLVSKNTGLPGYQVFQLISKIVEIVEDSIESIPKNTLENLTVEKQGEYLHKLKEWSVQLKSKRVA